MAEKLGQGKTTIKHRGFFNLQKLLKTIQGFFSSRDFVPDWENLKVRSDEYEVIFNADKKVTEWVKFSFRIQIWIYDLKKVEIVKEGKKIKMDEGKITCEVTPTLILDWQNRFEKKGPFEKFTAVLKDLHLKYIMKRDIGDYWEDVIAGVNIDLCKAIQAELGQEVI
jgi:hypothetical protein